METSTTSHNDAVHQSDSAMAPPAPLTASNAKRFRNGRILMGIGVLLMALSFGINLLFYNEGKSFVTIMYVLTGIGSLLIFKALMDFFS